MAGEWIKMRNDLAEDPAVIGIAGTLGVDEDLVVGKLHRLWSWADRQSRDGHATGVTNVWINRHIRLEGFAEAMVAVRWLEITPTGITFPNFERHNGETAKTRALGSKRKQKQRAIVTQPVPDVSRNERDKSETREEKRREDKEDISPKPAKVQADDLFVGVSPSVVQDFKALRKAKKAPITQTAVDGIRREANKAGFTLEDALKTCCERGWIGFKSDWVESKKPVTNGEGRSMPRLVA